MKEVCGATSHIYDGRIVAVKHQVNGTQLAIYIMYICIYFAILSSSKMSSPVLFYIVQLNFSFS